MGKKRAANFKKMIRYLVTVIMLISFTMTTITVDVSAEVGHNHQQDVTDQHNYSTAELGGDHSNHGHELIDPELLEFTFQEYADHNISNLQYRVAVLGLSQFGNAFIHEKVEQQDPQVSGLSLSNKPGDIETSSYGRLITQNWNPTYAKVNHLQSKGRVGLAIKIAIFDSGIDLNNKDIKVSGGVSFIEGINSYGDDNGHGTAMAGILTTNMQKNNFSGTAPEIELYSVKVLNKDGIGNYSNVIKGIDWAIDNQINIITLSLGGYEYSQVLRDAIDKAIANNILVIAAAGNDGADNIMYPAAYPEVISVGALNSNMQIADFSNYGEGIDLLAPGEGISSVGLNGKLLQLDGTSCAVQQVARVAALFWSSNTDLTNKDVASILVNNSNTIKDKNNKDYKLLDSEASYLNLEEGDYSEIQSEIKVINYDNKENIEDAGINGVVYAQACAHIEVVVRDVAATCTAAGAYVTRCSRCGVSPITNITRPKLGHLEVVVNDTKATCTTAGAYVTRCSRCGASPVTNTTRPKLGHLEVVVADTAATCTANGAYVTRCSRCGASPVTNTTRPKLGHIEKVITDTAATCTEDGRYLVKCSRAICGGTVLEDITRSKLGHDEVVYQTLPANCTQDGTSITRCIRCEAVPVSRIPIPKLGHITATDTVAATCTNSKKDVLYCKRCRDVLQVTNIGLPLGHNYIQNTIHLDDAHFDYKECSRCYDIIDGKYVSYDFITIVWSHTSSGHLIEAKCGYPGCNEILASSYYSSSYSSTGTHTASGHKISSRCSYCGTEQSYYYKSVSTCLSCTTAPSVSFTNLNGNTLLKKEDTNFLPQIKVSDEESDNITCYYYIDTSTSAAGTLSVKSTKAGTITSFTTPINVANLSEGSHTIKVTAKDPIATSLGTVTTTFLVDKTTPIIQSVNVGATSTSVKLIVSAVDTISGLAEEAYRFTINGVLSDWLTTSSSNFTELQPNNTYSYSIEVRDKVGYITTNSGTFITQADIPVVTATALSENKAEVVIKDSNPTSTQYKLQMGDEYVDNSGNLTSTESWITLPEGTVTEEKSVVISGLLPDQMYTVKVSVKNSATGSIVTSNIVSILAAPEVPSNFTTTENTHENIKLSWKSETVGAKFEIHRERLTVDGTVFESKDFVETTLLTCEDNDVSANQYYRYKIRAINSAGLYSSWSETIEVKTLPLPAGQVKAVSATSEGTLLTINWNSIEGAVGYKIIVHTDGETKVITSMTNSATIEIEKYNAQCDITVQAFNVTVGGDPADSTKWRNGGELSEQFICYTQANQPTLNNIEGNFITPNSVKIEWQTVNNPASVEYKLGIFKEGILIKEVPYLAIERATYETTINGLESETAYGFKLKAINSAGIETAWSNEVSIVTLVEYPDIPGRLRATAKADKIILAWDNADKAQSYQLERDGEVIATDIIGNSYIDEGLTPETEYNYRVKAMNTTGSSGWGQPLIKKTLGELLLAPVFSSITASETSAAIEWTAVEGANGYDLEADGLIYNVGLDTSFVHNSLTPGSYHTYRIRTRNNYGKGDWSTLVTEQLPEIVPTIPGIPGGLVLTTSENEIKIEWSMISGADTYDVEVDGSVITNIIGNKYLYVVPGENLSGTEHSVRVRAANKGGLSDWSESAIAILTAPGEGTIILDPVPSIPNVVCTAMGPGIIRIEWDLIEGATVYQLEADNVVIYTGSDSSYTHFGLEENSQHSYRVSAGNLSGYSEFSNPISAITGNSKTTTPDNITYYRESDSLISVTWNEVNLVDGYQIEVNGTVLEGLITDTKTSISIEPGKQYDIRIAAVILKEGETFLDWSEEITFRTPDKLPKVPEMNELEVSSNTIQVSFAEISGATGYELEVDGQIIYIHNNVSYTITNLEGSSSHTIRVRAYNEAGTSDWCEAVTVTTDEGIPGVPINITGKALSEFNSDNGSAILLSWKGQDGANTFEVEDQDGNKYQTETESIRIEGLQPGKTYTFRVRALTEAGEGAWSSKISLIPVVAKPSQVSVTAEDGKVTIAWGKVGTCDAYEIEIDGIVVATVSGTSLEFGYSTFFTNRTIRVRACSGDQKSEWSEEVVFEQSLPVTSEVLEGEEITIVLPVKNAVIGNYKMTLTYNTEELELLDACEMTPDGEITTTYIEEYNLHVIIEKKGTIGTVTFLVSSEDIGSWTGTISMLKFKSLKEGTITVSYGVTENKIN